MVHQLSRADPTSPVEDAWPSYSSVPTDCEICQQIMRAFHSPFATAYSFEPGRADIVFSKPCSTHGPLLAGLQERFNSGDDVMVNSFRQITGDDATLEDAVIQITKSAGHTNVDIVLNLGKANGGLVEVLELVNKPSDGHVGRGLIPDPAWINSSLPRAWKNCCQESHGDNCERPLKHYRLSDGMPTWLIDVNRRCLVPGKPGMDYVTLSYKWGQTERAILSKGSLLRLQEEHILSTPDLHIPKTIQNAMDVTTLLGEDYLWTDSLCITQDDEATKYKELNQMAAIYANSVVTIIAADGEDADHGLRGLQSISDRRELKFDRWKPFGEHEKVINPRFPWHHVPSTSYFNRGWTFQEYLFSKRRLIFEQQMMRWECSTCKWQEDIVQIDGPESKVRINWLDVVKDRYPSLGSYGYMLLEYNHRQFTYQEDALPAITGLLSMLSQKYEGGFLCGIPEMYFEAGLNWGPWSQDLTRRTSSNLSSVNKSLTILPSWSWVGWEGRISGNWRSNQDYLKRGRYGVPMDTLPITEWYTTDDPSGRSKRRIGSKFLHERQIYKDQAAQGAPLDPGWTQHPHDPKTSPAHAIAAVPSGDAYEFPPPRGLGNSFYTHESTPGIEFWYPIPIMSADTQPIVPPQTQYLFCDTYRAFLYASTNEPDVSPFDSHATLRDKLGSWAGILLLHSVKDKDIFDTAGQSAVELVAISRGCIARDAIHGAPEELKHNECPQDADDYEFYNVLWVEWKDGVAYRKALGRVEKGVWEKQELEAISLVLG